MRLKPRVSAFQAPLFGGVQAAYLDRTPPKWRALYKRVMDGKATQKYAIKCKCYECCDFEDIPKRVYECSVYSCPLWEYRQQKKGEK
jgi:hypothetical protein